MKKTALIIGSIVAILFIAAYYFVPQYALGLVKEYKPYTFERVLENDTMRVNYGIYENINPADYGYADYEEVTFKSIQDGNQLSSWYVPSKRPSEMTILLVHGRWSNRLKTMKYLELIHASGLDTLYNVMLPDLRNSGRSEPAPTMMGYEFAEDISSNMLWLSETKDQSELVIYAFSMGAMATAILINRVDLMTPIHASGINIQKIILESPVANVDKILRIGGAKSGLPAFMLDRTMDLLNNEYDGFIEQMKFSLLLADTQIPILILQGTGDQSQPIEILEFELKTLTKGNLTYERFAGAEHVRIYQNPTHRERYTEVVQQFIYGK